MRFERAWSDALQSVSGGEWQSGDSQFVVNRANRQPPMANGQWPTPKTERGGCSNLALEGSREVIECVRVVPGRGRRIWRFQVAGPCA